MCLKPGDFSHFCLADSLTTEIFMPLYWQPFKSDLSKMVMMQGFQATRPEVDSSSLSQQILLKKKHAKH
jgi:hypothetical protein